MVRARVRRLGFWLGLFYLFYCLRKSTDSPTQSSKRVEFKMATGCNFLSLTDGATAMNAQYFAVAHEGEAAHAFTFHALWWEIFTGNDHMKEDLSQCLCEANSFIDDDVLENTEEGKVMCGCVGYFCWRKTNYNSRFGEDNDRRWAIYKTMNGKIGNSGHYVLSKELLAVMYDIVLTMLNDQRFNSERRTQLL